MAGASGLRVPRRRTSIYLVVLAGSIFGFAVLYRRGMAVYEDTQKTFLQSLQVVVETYTTAGYGSDTPWTSPQMNVFVIAMNTVGTIMIFLALPVFLTPTLRSVLERSPPTALSADPSDHVVLASYSPRMELLTDELGDSDVDYVIVEPDAERAMELHRDGEQVVHGSPDELPGLEAARVRDARALVVDVDDETDASIVLSAREVDDDLRVVSVVDEPERAPYHRLAGADAVLSPRPVLGKRLAEMATAAVRTELGVAEHVGDDVQIVELPVARGGDLDGETVESSGLASDPDVHVVGTWRESEFECPPPDDAKFDPGTVVLAVGRGDALTALAKRATGRSRESPSGQTVVVGNGEVGRAVGTTLEEWNLPYTVVDLEDDPSVDVVGDATEPYTLELAGVEDADALVLAIPDDGDTEFSALVGRDLSEEVHLAARADDQASVRRLYRAGADYVLSVNGVTGRLLGATVLEETPLLATDSRVGVVTVDDGDAEAAESEAAEADDGETGGAAGKSDGAAASDDAHDDESLAGQTVDQADLDLERGRAAVAVYRDGEIHADLDDEFVLEAGDELVLVGTDEDLAEFTDQYG